MKYIRILPIIISLFLLIQLSANAQPGQQYTPVSKALPDGVEVQRDIEYVKYQNRGLLLDVYRPSNSGNVKLPTILVIRGGGWASGDKDGFGPIAAALALRGFATVCIEYRASGEATYPAAVLDTKAAVKWIKMNADKYNFDSSAIGAIGGSAGAHLALLLGVSDSVSSLNPTGNFDDYKIDAVVGMATPTDLTAFPVESNDNSVSKWLGKSYQEDKELWSTASPNSHIDKNSPPILLMHGTNDSVVPFEQSFLAMEKLAKTGVYAEMILIPDAPHPFWNYEEWFDSSMDKAASFFHEQLDF